MRKKDKQNQKKTADKYPYEHRRKVNERSENWRETKAHKRFSMYATITMYGEYTMSISGCWTKYIVWWAKTKNLRLLRIYIHIYIYSNVSVMMREFGVCVCVCACALNFAHIYAYIPTVLCLYYTYSFNPFKSYRSPIFVHCLWLLNSTVNKNHIHTHQYVRNKNWALFFCCCEPF